MAVVYGDGRPDPLTHTVWTGDFMGMCKHNIPCAVCFDAPAMIVRNVTPGQASQTVQPCRACQQDGWEIRRAPWWRRLFDS